MPIQEELMLTPRTSIIMPVYNTANTVINAIQSVRNQTDPDFELLIMIDGSPDDSAEIITDYHKKTPDNRIRIFNNPENKGVSAVRNQGLNAARGDWITFIDSDDEYEPQFLERMHRATDNADVIVCAHTMLDTAGKQAKRLKGEPGIHTGEQAAYELLQDQLSPYPWDKLIRASLLEGVRFPIDIHRAEDECLLLSCFLKAHAVTVLDDSLYRYTVAPGSLTWSRITPVEETHRLIAYFEEALGKRRSEPDAQKALTVARVLAFLNNAQQALVVGGDSARETLRACCKGFTYAQALTVLRTNRVFGAAGVLLKTSPKLYRILYGIYIKRTYKI